MGSRESLPRGVAHLWWQVPLTIVTWLVLFEFPYPPGTSLDSSWQQVLTDAWIHRRAFGSDFDFTYGPWGFLLSPESTRESFWIHVAFELGAKLLFAIAFVEIAGRLRLAFRVMFLAAVVVLGWPHNDPTEMAFVVVVSLAWLLPDTSRPPRIVLGGFVLAWLALMKVSLLVFASLSVATVVALAALQGRRRRAAGIAATYLCALGILWLGAGQRLADAREFLFLASQLSLGYASAMYLDEGQRLFDIAVALVVVHAAWLVSFVRKGSPRLITILTAGYLAVTLMLAWRQGFARADLHVLCFFVYSVLLVTALPALVPRSANISYAIVVIVLAAMGSDSAAHAYRMVSWNPFSRMTATATQLVSFRNAHRRFEEAAAISAAEEQLPAVRAAVGDHSIDFLGDRQALIFFNGLNYHPRPLFQSYAVYTRALLQKNFDFIQSDRRPEYLLAELQPVDRRFGGSTEPWLMAELPARYESVLFERGLVLLKQRDPQPRPRPPSLTPIYESDVAFGQRVELPADRTHALWLEIDARPTIIGRIRSLIYRPASVAIATSDDFGTRSYRLIAPVAEAGVIVQPPLSNTRDLNAFVTGNVGNWTKSFTIDARSRFWRSAHVRLSRLDAISLAPHGKSVFEAAGVADLRPESIRSDVDWRVDELPQPRLLLHPPGEMVFRPPVGRRRLSGEFGIFDGAFTGGQTDGVEFSIWFARGRGSDQRAWGVTLQPLTRTEDRGTHRFSIDLPADSDLRVIIRTGPGPSGKIDWDWSYLSKLRFTSRDP